MILTEAGNFPTDLYIAEGLARLLNDGHEVRSAPADGLDEAIGDDVAVVLLTEVNYRTGARLDMGALTRRAHACGALIIWDLCHSAGAFPVDLAGVDADFAVGCGYKYLNGGPGAPAFAYVAPRHLDGLRQPLTGWLGHAAPFEFARDLSARPLASMPCASAPRRSFRCRRSMPRSRRSPVSTSPRCARKADALFDLFTAAIAERAPELELLTPRDAAGRGTQVSFRHPEAYAVMQALIAAASSAISASPTSCASGSRRSICGSWICSTPPRSSAKSSRLRRGTGRS